MQPPNLLDQVRTEIRCRHLSRRTEKSYVYWIDRFILYNKQHNPKEMGAEEIRAFLSHLAVDQRLAASTQNLALDALRFFYRNVLVTPLPAIDDIARARRLRELPVVFTHEEARAVLAQLDGTCRIVAGLLYGAGLRLCECLALRVKDLDFKAMRITVRQGTGRKNRITMLPQSLVAPLSEHLQAVRRQHWLDLDEGYGEVPIPDEPERMPENAARKWCWQYVFPASRRSADPRTGKMMRLHLDESAVQRTVKRAVRSAGITKPGSPHTFRHSCAAHLLENGYDVRTVQELLGHGDVRTTMNYIRVLSARRASVRSPLDVDQ